MKLRHTLKESIIFLFPLLVLISINPFFEDPFLNSRYITLSLFLLFTLLFAFIKHKPIEFHTTFWFFFFLSILSIATASFSINTSESILDSSNYIIFGTVFLLFYNLDSKQMDLLIKSFCLSAILICLVIFWSIYSEPNISILNIESFNNLTSLLGHKNISSAALVLLIPLLIYSLIKHSILFKAIAFIGIIFSVYSIFILQARSSYLALLGFLILLIFYYILKANFFPESLKLSLTIVGIIIFLVSFIFLNPFNLNTIDIVNKRLLSIMSFGDDFSDSNKTIYERLFLWKGTISIIKEQFLIGVGAGNWKIEFPFEGLIYSRAEQGKIIFQRPHNDFLWVFSEVGFFGLLTYLMIFIKATWLSLKKIVSFQKHKQKALIHLLSFAGVLMFFVLSNFSFPKERPFLMLVFLFYLAIIFKTNQLKNNRQQIIKISYLKHTVLFIFISLVLMINILRFNSQYNLFNAQKANTHQDWTKKNEFYQKANKPYYTITSTATPVKWYEGVSWTNLKQYSKAKDCFLEAKKHNPSHLQTLNNLGSIYEILGEHTLAKNTFYEALAISPLFYDANINLSSLHYNLGELDAAFFSLSKVKDHPNIMDERYFNNMEVILKAIVIQLYEKGGISESKKVKLLKNMNFLKLRYIESGPNYTNFIIMLKE